MSEKELEARVQQIELQNAVDKAVEETNAKWRHMVHAVCITATTSVCGFFIWLGTLIYDNFKAVEAGVKAVIYALRSGQ